MTRTGRFFLVLGVSAGVSLGASALPSAAQQSNQRPANNRDERQLYRELATPYKKWLDEDVQYIIADEERRAFLQLQTNEEREQFIEAFWQRRNPNPDSMENAFKEEHYRRIAYANERFSSGVQGWRTDRGRMYIMWGPPTSQEHHTHGENWVRPFDQGGGMTKTFAWEQWNYNYLEGVGQDVTLEFVDPTGTGEFRLTMNPAEKDAMLHVPGAGLTLSEEMGLTDKADRIVWDNGVGRNVTGGSTRSMNQFERMELYAKVFTPPQVKFKDLEALVSSRIVRDQMRFNYQFDYLRVTGDTVLVPVTVQIPNQEMSYQNREGVHVASVNLFGRISSLTGRVVQVFEEEIRRDVPDSLLQQTLKGSSIYQKSVPLRPGLYRLDIVLKDVNSGDVGVVNTRLAVPPFEEGKVAASSLILADEMTPVAAREIGLGQFVIGNTKVRPKLDKTFRSNQTMGIFLQLYGLKIDENTRKNNAAVEFEILKGSEQILLQKQTSEEISQTGEQMTLEKLVPANALEPGKYQLHVRVTDALANQTISRTADFTVVAADPQPAAAPQASVGR
jgi:GWxTD domain-containing protein